MRHLTLSEYLRPWAKAGLTHLLVGTRPLESEVSSNENRYSDSQDTKNTFLYTKESSHAIVSTPFEPRLQQCQEKNSANENSNKNFSLQSKDLSVLMQRNYTKVEDLPLGWQKVLAKTSIAPVVWTYRELGYDLISKSSKERSSCLRAIIGKLALPKGSSSFLPYSLPSQGKELIEDVDAFSFGVSQVSPRVIIFLGEDSSMKLVPSLGLTMSFKQKIYKGVLYVQLPELSALYNNTSLIDSACSYLRSALTFLYPR